jgi:hypothetical protein
MMEFIKHLSDKILIWFLKSTSGFGAELTREGHEEQQSWREQRLRNLTGLAIRSKERYAKKAASTKVS